MDLGVEIDAWMDSRAIFRDSALGMVLDPKQVHAARKIFRDRPEVERLEVADLLADFHGELAEDILAEEHRACGTHGDELDKVMAGHARGLWDAGANVETVVGAEAAYFERWESRQAPSDWRNNANATLWARVNRKADGTDFVCSPPEGLDEGRLLWALPHIAQPTWWRLWQRGRALHLLPRTEAPMQGMSPLTEIRLRLPRVTLAWRDGRQTADLAAGAAVDLPLANDQATTLEVIGDLGNASVVLAPHPAWADRFWRDGSGLWVETTVQGFKWKVEEAKRSLFGGKKPKLTIVPQDVTTRLPWPTWATRLEKDKHGLVVELELADNVVTRLRWIPPGRFLMGSPEDEKGRREWEGTQHWVTLSKGYWLADAPCTQAEWQAVMGTAPSNFKGPNLPVERVSWEDCQAFCERLRARFPGLEARLPSEAEWEYACRAGTASACNDGSACTQPEGADPALAKLGWFDKNSGSKTHPVRALEAPNQWGLHDMHGNVWEWCQDWVGAYSADDQVDPTGADSGHGRVSRGGSWFFPAGFCRSASRGGWQPVDRARFLGFRLASGQSGQASEERAAGKQAGRRPVAPGGERPGKKEKK